MSALHPPDPHAEAGHQPASPGPLRVPDEGLIGLARDFADLFAEHLESPRSFFYFVFLSYFGACLAGKIRLESELNVQPRLYTVLLGESADTRKSTALVKVSDFFKSLGPEWTPLELLGVGSAEGLAQFLNEQSPTVVLHFDELKTFVDKSKNEHSVALPMITTLFERGDYDNVTKRKSISVRGARVSLVAASTKETYATMFDGRFRDIGFLNRLWLVSDQSNRRIAVPGKIPEAELEVLRQRTRALLERIEKEYVANGPLRCRMTPAARRMFEEWYQSREGSIFERRLDTYGHRLALLLAVTSDKKKIDKKVMQATLALLQWQLEVRRECDPVDAENTIAALEEKIRRVLARGPLSLSELKRRCNYSRYGLWMWNTALQNLQKANEVIRDAKTGHFRFNEATA